MNHHCYVAGKGSQSQQPELEIKPRYSSEMEACPGLLGEGKNSHSGVRGARLLPPSGEEQSLLPGITQKTELS